MYYQVNMESERILSFQLLVSNKCISVSEGIRVTMSPAEPLLMEPLLMHCIQL